MEKGGPEAHIFHVCFMQTSSAPLDVLLPTRVNKRVCFDQPAVRSAATACCLPFQEIVLLLKRERGVLCSVFE